jgi:hypothetical protein
MPQRPALRDSFELRFSKIACSHLLQSAKVARENGLDEKVIMACMLHDIAIAGLLSANHGYWGAQMVGPYVNGSSRTELPMLCCCPGYQGKPTSAPRFFIAHTGATTLTVILSPDG